MNNLQHYLSGKSEEIIPQPLTWRACEEKNL
jgi:hypothetical protein